MRDVVLIFARSIFIGSGRTGSIYLKKSPVVRWSGRIPDLRSARVRRRTSTENAPHRRASDYGKIGVLLIPIRP